MRRQNRGFIVLFRTLSHAGWCRHNHPQEQGEEQRLQMQGIVERYVQHHAFSSAGSLDRLQVAQSDAEMGSSAIGSGWLTAEFKRSGQCLSDSYNKTVQHGVGMDLKDASRRADTQALRQAGPDAHDEVDLGLFAVEDGAMRFQKVTFARRAVELTPGATAGMTVGP